MRPTVYVSNVINASVESVWRLARDFNALPNWHPMIDASQIEGNLTGDMIGAVRDFTLDGGGRIRERLLTLSDIEHRVGYSIIEAPVPVEDYVAELQFHPITETGGTFGQWRAQFEAPEDQKAELIELVSKIFRSGFKGLADRLSTE